MGARRPMLVLFLGALVVVASARPGGAQALREEQVPSPLKAWIRWALDGSEDRVCPVVGQSAVCLWPGHLALNLTATGGTFSLDAFADRAIDLPLPGGDKRWPMGVFVDGRPAIVVDQNGQASTRLVAGAHRVEGRFGWDRLPDSLEVPPAIGIVDLIVDGRPSPLPKREADGLLLLRQAGSSGATGENIQLKVFRQVIDGIPLFVETRVALEASGRAREVSVAGALLEGSIPISVTGDVPARLDADGRLRIQVRAGTFAVNVRARLQGHPDSLRFSKNPGPWPSQEVWVFQAAPQLRQVEPQGPSSIDPSRTDLPEEWRALPAFLMEEGQTLSLREVQRGEPEAAPDQITLRRQLWLDEGGGGMTARDSFAGLARRTSRLNLLAPGVLGRVAVDGQGQLITQDPRSHDSGVEVRKAALALEADSRLRREGNMRAVGWATNVHGLQTELYLPPGWRLFGTSGVDHASGTWLGEWNLWGFFFVLLTGLAAQRLLGNRWGAATLVTLVLIHGENGAPQLLWLSLLAGVAWMAAAPSGIFRTLARVLWVSSLVLLVFFLVPFVTDEVRIGLFPELATPSVGPRGPTAFHLATRQGAAPAGGDQLADKQTEEALRSQGYIAEPTAQGAPAAPPAQYAPAAPPPVSRGGKKVKSPAFAKVENSFGFQESRAYEQDPHAVIQTGTGVPSWTWSSYSLSWSGPVAADHGMRIFLLSPGFNLCLALLRVLCASLLALRLAVPGFPNLPSRLRLGPWFAAGALVLLVLVLPSSSRADDSPKAPGDGGLYPSAEMLQDLKDRLTRAPSCAPHCVSTSEMRLLVLGSDLHVEAEVHAAAPGSWALPGPASSWIPSAVAVDGRSAEGLMARLPDGFLHLRVSEGVHHVTVMGSIGAVENLTLQFHEKPHHATVLAAGFQVDGIHEDGTADESVQLSRRLAAGAGPGAASVYEPWLEVERTLNVGVSWTVETVVRRVSPTGVPVVVKVPLLKGMLVTDSEHQVKNGEVLVTLGPDETETRWSATLSPGEGQTVTLRAAEGKPWSEVWMIHCGLVWQCEASGLAPVSWQQDGQLAPEFRPWPGETLSLRFGRPIGIDGQTMTIDKVHLHLQPGQRLEDTTLDLNVRASRPGPLTLLLPAGAEIQELKVKGVDQPIRPEGQKVTVTLDRGDEPIHVSWRNSGGLGILHRVPPISIGLPAVNLEVTMQMPRDRWLLLVGGPAWGPHVLYWGYLLVVLWAALLLGRLPGSPLRGREWILLALGLTQIPAVGALVVAGWFLVFAWREGRSLSRPVLHDALQLGLVVWTLLALGFLYGALHGGLLLRPDMQVGGGGSTDVLLRWYQDRIGGSLPRPWVLSLPLWVYKCLMLAWALWLALALIRIGPWAWRSFTSGSIWQRLPSEPKPSEEPSTPAS